MIWRGCKKLGIWNENQKLVNPSRFLMIRIAAWFLRFNSLTHFEDYCLEGCVAMQSSPGAYCYIQKDHNLHVIRFIKVIRGSFQKFCALYLFSLKMNLFYKIHFQVFNVISIVLYHSGPTSGQVLYSCQDAFVVDASDYSGHLIRHLLNASEAFPTEWFLEFWEQVKGWWAHVRTVRCVGKQFTIRTFPKFPIPHLRHEAAR